MDLEEFEGLIDDYQLAQESGKYKARVDARIALKDAWRGLEAERDALRADAARYRWLRDAAGTVDWTVIHPSSSWSRITTNYCRTTAGGMDAAIDAAIAAKEPANGQG